MAVRNLHRRPWQAIFTMFGLSLATAIPIVPGAMREGIDYILSFQWSLVARQDATVTLIEPSSSGTLNDLLHMPGVMSAEPFRSVPARLRFGHHSRRLGVTGLSRNATLNRLLDVNAQPVALPIDGLLLSAKLAEVLGAKAGDKVIIEVQEGRRPVIEATIQGTVADYAGIAAYMEIGALQRILREGGTMSGAHLAVDAAQWTQFLQSVEESPRIASLGITAAVRKTFQKTTGEMIGKIQFLYFMFAT